MTGPERSLTMRMARTAAVLLMMTVVVFSGACKKRKPKLPPETTAPTITVPQPQPAPPPATTPTTNPAPSTPNTSTTTTTPVVKPKPKHHVAHKPKPPAPAPQPTPPAQQPSQQQSAKANPPANGDAMTISPDLPKNEVDAQKRDTEQLLQNAEADLRKLTRALSDGEQEMVRNARNYITQSRLATQDGDLERAHKLAVKAKLLSAELVK